MDIKALKPKKKPTLKGQMQGLIANMDEEIVGSPEYMEQLEQLEKIAKVDRLMKETHKTNAKPFDWNTALVIAGSIGEILLIMHYEEVSNFTGKAFSRILRPKLP